MIWMVCLDVALIGKSYTLTWTTVWNFNTYTPYFLMNYEIMFSLHMYMFWNSINPYIAWLQKLCQPVTLYILPPYSTVNADPILHRVPAEVL